MTARHSADLLDQLTTQAYATEYPARQQRALISRPWWSSSIAVSALITLLITAGLSSTRLLAPQRQQQRGELIQRLGKVRQATDALASQNTRLRRETRELSLAGLSDSSRGRTMLLRLNSSLAAAGGTSVSGAGLCITLADSNLDDGRTVTDRDLQALVNEMWRRGARATAINGIRLTAQSAIRTAGEAILVSYRPLAWPYRVCALDAPAPNAALSTATAAVLLRKFQQDYGVESKSVRSAVTVPAARLNE